MQSQQLDKCHIADYQCTHKLALAPDLSLHLLTLEDFDAVTVAFSEAYSGNLLGQSHCWGNEIGVSSAIGHARAIEWDFNLGLTIA